MEYLVVNKWGRFQHYKNRNPPWIKFYACTLDDYQISQLPELAQLHLLKLWLVAARMDNKIPFNVNWLAERLSCDPAILTDSIERLLNGGWLKTHAISELDACQQTVSDMPPADSMLSREEKSRDRDRRGSTGPVVDKPAYSEQF